MSFEMPDSTELVRSLVSTLCPACKRAKKTRQTFCTGCYMSLGRGMRNALYDRVGEGYEQAYKAAFILLMEKGRVRNEAL
jgi:hypothetical protein